MENRLLPLEGVHNFRDFGGYVAADGRRVRRRRLFRSAHLGRATDSDLDAIGALDIRLVADLRRPLERAIDPSRWAEGVTPQVISAGGDDEETLPPHVQYLKDAARITEEGVRDYMLASYTRMAYDERHVDLFTRVFAALAETGGPLLVHCAAGKDRTGLLCGLILDTLGVSEGDILDDYELTNAAVNLDGIADEAALRIAKRLQREVTPAEIRPMASVSREYLKAAWAAIAERSGSRAAYRRDVLGVNADVEAALREALLEGM